MFSSLTFSVPTPSQVQETEIIFETLLIGRGRGRGRDKEEPLTPVITGRWHLLCLTASEALEVKRGRGIKKKKKTKNIQPILDELSLEGE